MIEVTYDSIVTDELSQGAILNEAMEGFKQDYLVLHCLIKKYPIKRLFEIGTNEGRGTKIIKNALGDGTVISLDLPEELAHQSKQHPISEGKDCKLGHLCNLPYVPVFGDSLTFNYGQYMPLDAFFIDGEHDFKHAYLESKKAIDCIPKLIVWHDADIEEVARGINDAISHTTHYNLYRVVNTRIAYAVRK